MKKFSKQELFILQKAIQEHGQNYNKIYKQYKKSFKNKTRNDLSKKGEEIMRGKLKRKRISNEEKENLDTASATPAKKTKESSSGNSSQQTIPEFKPIVNSSSASEKSTDDDDDRKAKAIEALIWLGTKKSKEKQESLASLSSEESDKESGNEEEEEYYTYKKLAVKQVKVDINDDDDDDDVDLDSFFNSKVVDNNIVEFKFLPPSAKTPTVKPITTRKESIKDTIKKANEKLSLNFLQATNLGGLISTYEDAIIEWAKSHENQIIKSDDKQFHDSVVYESLEKISSAIKSLKYSLNDSDIKRIVDSLEHPIYVKMPNLVADLVRKLSYWRKFSIENNSSSFLLYPANDPEFNRNLLNKILLRIITCSSTNNSFKDGNLFSNVQTLKYSSLILLDLNLNSTIYNNYNDQFTLKIFHYKNEFNIQVTCDIACQMLSIIFRETVTKFKPNPENLYDSALKVLRVAFTNLIIALVLELKANHLNKQLDQLIKQLAKVGDLQFMSLLNKSSEAPFHLVGPKKI